MCCQGNTFLVLLSIKDDHDKLLGCKALLILKKHLHFNPNAVKWKIYNG